jgi:hypothetical protein
LKKWQIEVQQSLLDSEEATIKELERQYARALKDINDKIKLFDYDIRQLEDALNADGLDDAAREVLKSQQRAKVYQKQYQEALKGQISGVVDNLHAQQYATIDKYLKECYTDGFVGTMYDISKQGIPIIMPIDQAAVVKAVLTDSKVKEGYYNALGVNYGKLKKVITQEVSRGIASGLAYRDIARNIDNASKSGLSNAKRIARTEGHRIQQTSADDARRGAISRGCDVVKQWDATLDSRTRDSHARVDGEIREEDEKFSNGLMFPGDPSGEAAEVVNCRCVALTRARWALDEAELETLKERAEYFGLDKSDSFEEFQRKYLKAAEEPTAKASDELAPNIVKAGKVEANGRFVNNKEKLYRYAEKITPIDGYDDFVCHADADQFYIDMVGNGDEEDYIDLSVKEFAEAIKNSKTFKGNDIRIISCQAGAKPNGAAQKLADELQVAVYAPTEVVNIDENGEMFLTDNDILADMWYYANEEERTKMKETGKWVRFTPEKR